MAAHGRKTETNEPVAVRAIMRAASVTVTPDIPTLKAIEVMRQHKVGCLPVMENGHLVGIVTAQDFLEILGRLFEQHLKSNEMTEASASEASSSSL